MTYNTRVHTLHGPGLYEGNAGNSEDKDTEFCWVRFTKRPESVPLAKWYPRVQFGHEAGSVMIEYASLVTA